MLVPNTKANRKVAQVVASLAVEEMYIREEFVKELMNVSNGEKTT